MLTVLAILGVLAVLFVAAVVATREGPILADAPADIADLELPDGPLQPEDLRAVRFALAVRGYRMDEVDRVLERAAAELAGRDERIVALQGKDPKGGPASVTASAASVVLAKPPVDAGPAERHGESRDPAPGEAPDELADEASDEPPVESAEPIAAVEAPSDSPPGPAAPPADGGPEPEVEAEGASDAATPAEDRPTAAQPATAREPVASLLPDPVEESADTASSANASDEGVTPPAPPPIEVAVVRTEVAPVPVPAPTGADDDDAASGAGGARPS